MSVLAPAADEVFNIRIYKRLDIAGERVWANSYEVVNYGGANKADLEACAQALVSFEQGMCHDTVLFDRAVISTYVPDGQPYNPESFISVPLTQVGTVSSPPAAEVLPLQVALFLRRDVPSGRYGKLFLRQTVGETDVSGRYGSFALTSPSAMNTRLSTAISASGLDDYFGGGAAPLSLALVGNSVDGLVVRTVTGLTVVDVRLIKFNNRYFDRV